MRPPPCKRTALLELEQVAHFTGKGQLGLQDFLPEVENLFWRQLFRKTKGVGVFAS
jgi:hypothetical protein